MRKGKGAVIVRPTDVGYWDLLADLKHPGCPVCRGRGRSAWSLVDSILWECVNDPQTRLELRASHGFCREHLYMAGNVASSQAGGLGMAILLEDFLTHVEQEAAELVDRSPRQRRRHPAVPLAPHGSCMACLSADRSAHNYLAILSSAEPPDEIAIAIQEPEHGLCVPHLAQGFRSFPGHEERRRLLSHFLASNQVLRSELASYIGKHDYQRHGEGMTEGERTAWPRAIARLVGAPKPTHPLSR